MCVVCANSEEAEKIAMAVLEARLAVCANILNDVRSLFIWQDNIDQSNEVILYLKTTEQLLSDVEKLVYKLHSYEVPSVFSIDVNMGSKYSEWMKSLIPRA